MSIAFDESGRPFIILREQSKKKRVKGLEAHKVSKAKQPFRPTSLFAVNPTGEKNANCFEFRLIS